MNLELNDTVIIVAGGSQGLGLATAIELAREGASVMVTSRSEKNVVQAAQHIIKETGQQMVRGFAADMTDAEAVTALVSETLAQFGRIDSVVTNTSGPKAGLFDQMGQSDLDASYELMLKSATLLINASLPQLRKSPRASILTITSASAKQPIAGLTLSNIFRPAVLGLTKSLSQELAGDGIRVNSILPGWTSTARTQSLLEKWSQDNDSSAESEMEKINQTIPLGRFADPKEFGKVAAFLLSPAASYITGAMLQVDGGINSGLF